jgi:hypothetical protein
MAPTVGHRQTIWSASTVGLLGQPIRPAKGKYRDLRIRPLQQKGQELAEYGWVAGPVKAGLRPACAAWARTTAARIRRRTFIAGLGSAAVWPLAAWAQQYRLENAEEPNYTKVFRWAALSTR